jgi:hypothetical protein
VEIAMNKVEYLSGTPKYKGIIGAVVGVDGNSSDIKTSDCYIRAIEWGDHIKPRIEDCLK